MSLALNVVLTMMMSASGAMPLNVPAGSWPSVPLPSPAAIPATWVPWPVTSWVVTTPGELAISVNVDNAWLYIDGRRVAKSPVKKLPVTVGTHALRLTHEAHRDYVRFVRVKFEQTTAVDVKLDPVPVASRKMKLAKRVRVLKDHELPWYRRWWVVAGMGAALLATFERPWTSVAK